MPTYRVTAPDGSVYRVTPPEGTNPSEAEILARVQAQSAPPAQDVLNTVDASRARVKALEQTHAPKPTPGLYQRAIAPVTRGVGRVADVLTEPLVASERAAMGEPRGQIAQSYSTPGGIEDMNRRSSAIRNPVGDIVPQTPLEAGAMAGTMLVAPWLTPLTRAIPFLRAAPAASARVAAGAMGGEIGGRLSGETTGKGALIGGGGAVTGEVASAAGSKFLRSLPGAKGAIAAQDAVKYGTEMERQSSALAGARTAEDLRAMAAGPGRRDLGDAKDEVVRAIEARVGDIRVPSLGNQPMSLSEANRQLTEIGLAGRWGASPVDRTAAGLPARQDYRAVAHDIDAALRQADPAAAQAFADIQGEYRRGLALLKPLTRGDAFRKGGELQFNTPSIQRQFADPRVEAQLRARLGDEGFEALRNVMLRGGQPGEVDRLVPGGGNMTDAVQQWLRGTNTGATQAVGVPLRTLLPNVGSQYAGRAPYTLPAPLQAILDATLQRAGGAATSGERR